MQIGTEYGRLMKESKVLKERIIIILTYLKLGGLYGLTFFMLPGLVSLFFSFGLGSNPLAMSSEKEFAIHAAHQAAYRAQIMLLSIAASFVLVWVFDRSRMAEPWRKLGFLDGWLARLTAGWLWAYGITELEQQLLHQTGPGSEGWALLTGTVFGWSLLSWGSHWLSLKKAGKVNSKPA